MNFTKLPFEESDVAQGRKLVMILLRSKIALCDTCGSMHLPAHKNKSVNINIETRKYKNNSQYKNHNNLKLS